ncbi:3-methyl-2-oxobutanoate hydroxymethyltransferase [Salinisphaera aquimarina]|uniref:3-methyl-2-oxobutanoate hydroxymethyltransferase n=1 Tax=Salinisphaera aquimarina TaxID=2094031 RepID=A0ABV7EUQ3_9GAMM
MHPITPSRLAAMKDKGERIAALTAYDYTAAQMCEAAGIPVILVGDTLGMVVRGEASTLAVTLDDVIYHSRMVRRGAPHALVIADLPFMTYRISVEDALRNAGRLMQTTGVGGVKLEGGSEITETVARLVQAGIPVCGHLGYTPQSTHTLGGARVQGRNLDAAVQLIGDAKALEAAGAFAVVLELVPTEIAAAISRQLDIPTIGIGAGPDCDGEIQVFHDLFGLFTDFQPRHTRRYLNVAEDITGAARQFKADVADRRFPGDEQSSALKPELSARLSEYLGQTESLAVEG